MARPSSGTIRSVSSPDITLCADNVKVGGDALVENMIVVFETSVTGDGPRSAFAKMSVKKTSVSLASGAVADISNGMK